MSKYKQIRQYLDSFISYEKQADFVYCRALKLERVRNLLRRCGVEYEKLKVIHIAGTKGKGSTATMCADLLASAGYKVGLYTSPHFFDFRERIAIKSPQSTVHSPQKSLISRKDVARIVRDMKPYLEKRRVSPRWGKLTFFEVYTAVAFKYFADKKVDFAVLETGMGGRLDATNVVTPLVSIITSISYDHTDKLGSRLTDIAYEKAGIIKNKGLVVCSSQRKSVGKVIGKRCKELNAGLFTFGRDFTVQNITQKLGGTRFDFKFGGFIRKNIRIILKGKCQIENAALALAAVKLLKDNKSIDKNVDFSNGLSRTFIAGRFEIIRASPLVIVDIAHNPAAFFVLRDNLNCYFPGREIILIFAASRDKDIRGMLKIIKYKHIILTKFNSPRCACPQDIKNEFRLAAADVAPDAGQAFKIARALYNNNSLILISGSFFLAAEAKKIRFY